MDRNCEYVWYEKGKKVLEGKEGYRIFSLKTEEYEKFVGSMRSNGLPVKRKRIYYHLSNNEEIEVDPEIRRVILKIGSDGDYSKRLEEICGIEKK